MHQELIFYNHGNHMKLWPCVYYSKINKTHNSAVVNGWTSVVSFRPTKSFGKIYGDEFQLAVSLFFE